MAIVITGSVVIALKYPRPQPVEISLPPTPAWAGDVYVGGEVNSPGVYPVDDGDTIEDVIRAAGGLTDNADSSYAEIIVPGQGEVATLQKININKADAWLLTALPGIGEVRAGAIIAYRQQHGPFRDINELLKVEGFGPATLENIKDLITIAD